MDAKAFAMMTDFLDEHKDKMKSQDYMTMMDGLKSLHDKKLVIDETKTTQPIRPIQQQLLLDDLSVRIDALIQHQQQPQLPPDDLTNRIDALIQQQQPRLRKCGICGLTGHDRRNCRSAVPNTGSSMITLFHFTSREASTHIIREEALKSHGLGTSIYFTAMDFETHIKQEIALNNWGKRENDALMECVFKVEVPANDVVNLVGRNVFHTKTNSFDLSKHNWRAFEIDWKDGKCAEKKCLGFRELELITL
jgi:hypothetical protein